MVRLELWKWDWGGRQEKRLEIHLEVELIRLAPELDIRGKGGQGFLRFRSEPLSN